MSNWNEGYVTDISYTNGYYKTLNPLRIKLCFLAQGILPPKIQNACELAFGQGISINFNACSSLHNWYGTDFAPSQVAFAESISDVWGGENLSLFDDSFEEFLNREDLPKFDFVAIHGIYSWISNENKRFIIEFLRKRLNVGGVVLISYNCKPGWAGIGPLRDVMSAYTQLITPLGNSSSKRAREGMDFIGKLMELDCMQNVKNPQIESMLNTLSKSNDVYLAHELLNQNNDPMSFFDMSNSLGDAKLNFASYVNFLDHLGNLQFSDTEREILSKVSHNKVVYEMLKDVISTTSFRSDYWAMGVVNIDKDRRNAEFLKLRVILSVPKSKIDYSISTRRGTLNLDRKFYDPFFKAIEDYKPKTMQEIMDSMPKSTKVSVDELFEAVIVLSSDGTIRLAYGDDEIQKCIPKTKKLNEHIMYSSISNPEYIDYLISPVSGDGVRFNRFDMMFLYALSHMGKKTTQEWVEFVWNTLESRGERMIKDGKTLMDKKDNIKELEDQAESLQDLLVVLEGLKIV